ncbi:adenosylcobinamide-GDP ribazoletransferase [Streptomyces niveus]|uniref:adenosylcobinamide-GDP ribazoletransferase n=1 Tax=Streptomyces niveus TaxID=193462 RepID=UPI00084BCAC1|nr:adenosylcobinamide-GDP ribazoletransferase [Streptomyces niveus]
MSAPRSTPTAADGIRFAFGTLTALPVRVTRWDREAARAGMLAAPLAGLVVGLCAAAVPAALTRGLHLDGLADTADGLGSAKPAEDALRIMKQSDIGPFGVITLLLVLLTQVAALTELYDEGWAYGAVAGTLAAVTARLALTLAARTGVPPARPDGLGATVAGSVPPRTALLTALLVAAVSAAACGGLFGAYGALHHTLALAAGLGTAQLLLTHCVRRFGGVTGDVFGGLAETAATAALVALTLG